MVHQQHFLSAVFAFQEGANGDDMSNIPLDKWDHTLDRQMLRELSFRRYAYWSCILLLIVPFFEEPMWCWNPSTIEAKKLCAKFMDSPLQKDILRSGIPQLPLLWTCAIDLVILSTIFIWGICRARLTLGNTRMSRSWFSLHNWTTPGMQLHFFRLLFVFIAIIDTLAPPPISLTPFLRPIIFIFYSTFRVEIILDSIRSIVRVAAAVFLLLLWIVLIAWSGMLLFNGEPEGEAFFPNFGDSFAQAYILMTVNNFPDILILPMKQNKLYFFFFAAALLCGVTTLTSVLLGSLYNANKSFMAESAKQFQDNFEVGCRFAFQNLILWQKGVEELREIPKKEGDSKEGAKDVAPKQAPTALSYEVTARFLIAATKCSPDELDTILDDIDEDDNRLIEEGEFLQLADKLQIFLNKPKVLMPEPLIPSLQWFDENQWRNSLMDLVVVINLGAMVMQTQLLVQQKITPNEQPFLEHLDVFLFTSLYILEFALRVVGTGFTYYFSKRANVVDFVVTIAPAAVTFIMSNVMDAYDDYSFFNWVLAVRLLRVTRLITERPSLEVYFETVFRLKTALTRLVTALLLLFYFYGALGETLFGGALRKSNPLLEGSDYASSDYYAINFNDWGSTMIMLFVLLMVNFTMMSGTAAAVGSCWARVYFISFHILAVWVIMGVFVAFIIEVFIETVGELSEEEKKEEGSSNEKKKLLEVGDEREEVPVYGSTADVYTSPPQ